MATGRRRRRRRKKMRMRRGGSRDGNNEGRGDAMKVKKWTKAYNESGWASGKTWEKTMIDIDE